MREQQVHPPLAAALLTITESHQCGGKQSLDGMSPISCSGDLRDVIEHPVLCSVLGHHRTFSSPTCKALPGGAAP